MILITGVAGFIGYHIATALLERGETILGIDNLNPYYDVSLKKSRLEKLVANPRFSMITADVSDRDAMLALADSHRNLTGIIHLAAQAGVRHSLVDPYVYVTSNVMGQVVMLELARRLDRLTHFVYASSSSVYGGNVDLPFSVNDPVEKPQSLYAATKRSDELIAYSYSHLYGIPTTGLRFFTVYGPWGRPDMAAYLFAKSITAGEPILVFNRGEMARDFTYVDDIVAGIVRAFDLPAGGKPPYAIYNLGNHRSERLLDFIEVLERSLGRKARLQFEPMQPGDVVATFADIEQSRCELGFEPKTPISEGIPRFVAWYREYHRI
jgi:UDP-glucuronate 4-epimerase